jgi:hypothetical protein
MTPNERMRVLNAIRAVKMKAYEKWRTSHSDKDCGEYLAATDCFYAALDALYDPTES